MSSLPGYTMEDFLSWNYGIVFKNIDGNESLRIAEIMGTGVSRPRLDEKTWLELLELFESYRNEIEYKLSDFDEDEQNWRDYAGYSFDFIPDEVYDKGRMIIEKSHDNLI